MYQNIYFLKLRSFLRKIGIAKIIGNLFASKQYEIKFDNAIFKQIREDDTIYDIGANRGLYTVRFLKAAPKGKVFAFEPVPNCNKVVAELQTTYNNLVVYPYALGSVAGEFPMQIGTDDLNATSSLISAGGANDIIVQLKTIDEMVLVNNSIPNFLKIDVEGFEYEVLKGMSNTIKNENVRVIAIEVHFTLLEKMGQKEAPHHIVKFLKTHNFNINWVDPSHIVAIRKNS